MKLKQKGRNATRQPEMLHQAKKYYSTQGTNMPVLGSQDALQIKTNFKPNQKHLKKYKDFRDQNMIGGNNFTLGLNSKLPSALSSNRNNLRSLPDQESYAVSVDKPYFIRIPNNALETSNTAKSLVTAPASQQKVP